MQSRAQDHHRERLSGAMREELSTILAGELGDPRIGLLTVTDMVLQPGGKAVHVYVAVEGDDEEAKQTMMGLSSATGYIRHELAEALDLRAAPELTFHLDRSQQIGSRIEELLKRTKKKRAPK